MDSIVDYSIKNLYNIPKINNYNNKMKIQKLIFKFKNLRKDKKIRKETKKIFYYAIFGFI